MRVPLSWLRDYVDIPAGESGRAVAERLVRAGLEVETVEVIGGDVTGPLAIGHVLEIEELTGFKKPIRFCQVAVGQEHGHPDTPGIRGIICGARNFAVGDLVVVALPGAVLPGGFAIGSRETYGRLSDGMICSERELGLGEDHDGILVLPPGTAQPGVDPAAILGLGDEVLDIAVTPDRGYCLSIRGVAREAATAYGLPLRDPGVELPELPPAAGEDPKECAVEDDALCDLFVLRTLRGFDPSAPTPVFMRRRLAMCGMRSISLAVDVTNYVMLEVGQPLHAFDEQSLRGPVVVRHARPGETIETLDHVVRSLDPDDLLITDDRGGISIAGIMGGLETEIGSASVDLVIEAAHFDAASMGRSSRRHKLSSEASRRFERGIDRTLPPYASARAIALLIEHGGGSYVGMTAVESPATETIITINVDLPSKVGGAPIDDAVVVSRLTAVGCEIRREGDTLTVRPPAWRTDLTDPNDLAEEVLRLDPLGYDAVPSRLPRARPGFGLTDRQRAHRRVGLALAGAGFTEVLSYPFVGAAELEALGIAEDDPRSRLLQLANPLSDEQPGMRTTLLPGLVVAARRNIGRGETDVALFETGSVTFPLPSGIEGEPPRPGVSGRPSDSELDSLKALLPAQPRHVAVLIAGDRTPAGHWGPAVPATWADAVEAMRSVASAVGADLQVGRGATPAPWHPGRVAQLQAGEVIVGFAGELAPKVCERMGLPARTCAAEVDLDALVAAGTPVAKAPEVNTSPVAKEDVALIVAADVTAAAVADALRAGGGELLESVRLFDEYVGPQVGEGRRSLAFALRMRARGRTLTAEETTAVRVAAVAAAEQATGAVLRG